MMCSPSLKNLMIVTESLTRGTKFVFNTSQVRRVDIKCTDTLLHSLDCKTRHWNDTYVLAGLQNQALKQIQVYALAGWIAKPGIETDTSVRSSWIAKPGIETDTSIRSSWLDFKIRH